MILAPFKWIVGLFFDWSYAVFGHPGWAVVSMSVLLSLLLTPLYVWIEARKASDRRKYAPMRAEIDKINAVYTGRERYYYTREIQRRYGFSSWTSLIPTLGLLVQIPFLLAAYHYLSSLSIFQGVGFGYIKDLSRPDTVAALFHYPVNFLPILMTLINLVSGWRYAESGDTKERVQYAGVALLFLILLYHCPSSVLIYWTLSNFLSLIRSEIFFRKNHAARTVVAPHRRWWTLARVRANAPVVIGSCLLVSTYFFLLGMEHRNISDDFPYSRICLVLSGVAFVSTLLLVGMLWFKRGERTRGILPTGRSQFVFLLVAGAYVFCTIFLWQPLIVFLADPSAFSVSLVNLFVSGMGIVLCGLVVLTLFWRFVRFGLIRQLAVIVVFYLSLVVLCYAFVLPFKSGTLQGAELINALGFIYTLPEHIVEVAFLVGLLALTVFLLRRVSLRGLTFVLLALNLLAGGQAIVRGVRNASEARTQEDVRYDAATFDPAVSGLRFSRRHPNLLVFLLDMVQGASFQTVATNASLAAALDGFTWYPNCVSVANMTAPSLPALYGGWKFAPGKIADDPRTVDEKCEVAMRDLKETLANRGMAYEHHCFTMAPFPNELNQPSPLFDRTFLSKLTGIPDCHAYAAMTGILWMNAALQSLPFPFKYYLYSTGRWRFGIVRRDRFFSFGKDHLFYEALPRLSAVVDSQRGFAHHIHAEVTHNPWGVPTDDGRFVETDNVGILQWMMKQTGVFLNWMRAQGVYDNTRIIFVSDHGLVNMGKEHYNPRTDPMVHKELWPTLISGVPAHWMLEPQRIQMLNSMLVVKDYGSHGALARAEKLVSNGDLRDVMLCENVKDALDTTPNVRQSYVTVLPDDGSYFKGYRGFDPIVGFEIRDNVFDLRNWKTIKTK